MIIDTPDGPKFEWEVDAETAAAALAETAAAAHASEARQAARRAQRGGQQQGGEATSAAAVGAATPASIVEPGLVDLARRGDVAALGGRLTAGCTPDVVAFEFDLFPGSKRMFCNDWTPLCAAAAIGEVASVELLLDSRADPNVVCCACTSSGAYNFWTALDIARTGDTIPFERDHAKHLQPRHPEVEAVLVRSGAKPASSLPEPSGMNTYGVLPEAGQRPNPCLDDASGMPLRPPHLYDPAEEEERRRTPGAPKLGRGVGGCPMTSIGMDAEAKPASGPKDMASRTLTGGARVFLP